MGEKLCGFAVFHLLGYVYNLLSCMYCVCNSRVNSVSCWEFWGECIWSPVFKIALTAVMFPSCMLLFELGFTVFSVEIEVGFGSCLFDLSFVMNFGSIIFMC